MRLLEKDFGCAIGRCMLVCCLASCFLQTAKSSLKALNMSVSVRAINQKRQGLPAIEVAERQLDKIIDFPSTKSNISKDLKTALLRFRKSIDDVKQDHVRLVKTVAAAEPAKVKVWRMRLLVKSIRRSG